MVYENDIYVKYSAAKDTLHNNMEENAKLTIYSKGKKSTWR